MKTRAEFYCILVLISFFLGCQKPKAEKPPNIVLFLVDDMGWQDTSVPFWNQSTPFNDIYKTPNMERLAKKG